MKDTKLYRAIHLTRKEIDDMDTGSLTNVAQTLGTSGKYTTRKELINRIVRQQRVTAEIYGYVSHSLTSH